MAKPRRLTVLVTFGLLITIASIVGHLVNDAMCVVLNVTGGYECSASYVSDGLPDSVSLVTAELHGSFDLPSPFPSLPLITMAFVLSAIVLAYLPYFTSPSLPPPKTLS